MIRRSLNPRFAQPVLDGIKTTTIRDKPWPIDKPIMLFRWEGLPYRSKQVEVAPIIVIQTATIHIQRTGMRMSYRMCPLFVSRLWHNEGFPSQDDMDEWFSKLVKPGQTVTKNIMRFRVAHELTSTAPISA